MPWANGNVGRVAVRWILNSADEQVNVHWFSSVLTGAIADEDMAAAVVDWMTAAYAIVNDDMTASLVHYDIDIRNVTVGYDMTPVSAQPALNGVGAGNFLPADDSALVVWRTAVSRRLGRKYLPTFVVSSVLNGRWTAATLTRLQQFADFMLLGYVYDPAITLIPGVKSSSSSAFSPFISRLVSNNPSRKGSRKVGVGS